MDIINILVGSEKGVGHDCRLMICPTATIYLSDDVIKKNPKLIVLKNAYDSIDKLDNENRVVLSLLNSLFVNNLQVFCLSRRSLEKIVLSDLNIENPSFVVASYNKYLKKIYDAGIKRLAPSQKHKKKSGIYYVPNSSPLKELIDSDFKCQLEAALAFAVPCWEGIDDKILLKDYECYFSSGSYSPKILNEPILNLISNLVLDRKIKEEIKENINQDLDIDFNSCSIDEMFLIH